MKTKRKRTRKIAPQIKRHLVVAGGGEILAVWRDAEPAKRSDAIKIGVPIGLQIQTTSTGTRRIRCQGDARRAVIVEEICRFVGIRNTAQVNRPIRRGIDLKIIGEQIDGQRCRRQRQCNSHRDHSHLELHDNPPQIKKGRKQDARPTAQ
jgi:hypothetical protein